MAYWLFFLLVGSVATDISDKPVKEEDNQNQFVLEEVEANNEDYTNDYHQDAGGSNSELLTPTIHNLGQKFKQFANKIFDRDSNYGISFKVGRQQLHPRRPNPKFMQFINADDLVLSSDETLNSNHIFKRDVQATSDRLNNTNLNDGTVTEVKKSNIVYLHFPEQTLNKDKLKVLNVSESDIQTPMSDFSTKTESDSILAENLDDESNINSLKSDSKSSSRGLVSKKLTGRRHPKKKKWIGRQSESTSKVLEHLFLDDVSVNTLMEEPYKNNLDCKLYLKNLLRIWYMLAKFIAHEDVEEPSLNILPNLFKLLSIYATLNSENQSAIPREKLIQIAIKIITQPRVYIKDYKNKSNKPKEHESKLIENIFESNENVISPTNILNTINKDKVLELPNYYASEESSEDLFRWDIYNSKESNDDTSDIERYKPKIKHDDGYNIVISKNNNIKDGIGIAVPVPKTKCQETALGALVDTFKKLYDEYVMHVIDCENRHHRHKNANKKYIS